MIPGLLTDSPDDGFDLGGAAMADPLGDLDTVSSGDDGGMDLDGTGGGDSSSGWDNAADQVFSDGSDVAPAATDGGFDDGGNGGGYDESFDQPDQSFDQPDQDFSEPEPEPDLAPADDGSGLDDVFGE